MSGFPCFPLRGGSTGKFDRGPSLGNARADAFMMVKQTAVTYSLAGQISSRRMVPKIVAMVFGLRFRWKEICKEIARHYKRHVLLMEEFDVYVPKHHLMVHLNHRAAWQGNPTLGATFQDEALNKVLKAVLRNCPQSTFEVMAISKMREALSRTPVGKRLRLV